MDETFGLLCEYTYVLLALSILSSGPTPTSLNVLLR